MTAYRVIITDGADAEAQAIYDWLFGFNAPAAFRFQDSFRDVAASLSENPNGWPIAEEDRFYARTVRRKPFRSGNSAYRLLFTVYEARELGPDEPETVYVLRVRHGSARPLDDTDTGDNGN